MMNRGSVEEVTYMRPGEGERRAIGGYYPQYRIAASLILRDLRNNTLQWIRVADPEAGRVDDLQIGSQARVDAYQVKWHMYGGNFTFNNLKTPSSDDPSLISQLADGWQRLRTKYPSQRVIVHLITNAIPSTADAGGIPIGTFPPAPQHFAAFIEQVWKPARNTPPTSVVSIPGEWQDAWEVLKSASGLSTSDFEAFIRDCELEFNYRLPGIGEVNSREDNIILRDLKDLTEVLLGTVADPQKIIELTHDELLARLNWRARFEFRSHHEFPVNDLLYQPIEDSVNQFEQSLNTLPGGYLAVLGAPGSGKSSLLTQTLRRRPERVIRYYAYIPDAQDPITIRGESVNFLHDIVLALKRAGFSHDISSVSSFDRDQLLQHLHWQLQELHKDWQVTGRKTIILIDGLDHISREQHPSRSLLHDLPWPEQVPEGIFFVLGSQTDQLIGFPGQVQYTIRQASRRIEMRPLPRKAVLEIIERIGLSPALSNEQKSQVYTLSSGHPLALAYLLQHLINASDTAQKQNILNMTEKYTGDIEKIYYSHWQHIEHNYELTHLLGLLARLRRIIDLSWIRSWAHHAVIDQLNRTLAHYFRREDHDRWYFFHNSFRLFLLKKTSESYPEIFDATRNRELHHELAEQCAKSQPLSAWSWEELYHRLSADEHDFVLQRATPSWFREQFFAFRPINSIRTDIQLALRSATQKQDPIALVRLFLIAAEMDQRASHLEHTSFIPLLFSLEKEQIVAEHVRDGNQLRVDRKTALQISYDLKLRGFEEEARRIFELAEPLELLISPQPIERTPGESQDEQDALLEAWTKAASQFRNVGQIIEIIRQLRRREDEHRRHDAETITQLLQSYLLFTLGDALLAQQRWDDLSLLYKTFSIDRRVDQQQQFRLQLFAIDAYLDSGEEILAQQLLEHTIQKAQSLHMGDRARVALAERIYRVTGDLDQIRTWVENLPQPALATAINLDLGLQPFQQRFRLNRLLYTLGSQASPQKIVPDVQDPNQQGMVYFERAICTIARLWADGWRGRKMDKKTFVNEARPILHFFSWHQNTNRQWSLWYIIKEAQAEFFTLLVKAAEQHGTEVIEELRLAFEQEWDDPEKQKDWPESIRRQTILALWETGISTNWAITRLRSLESTMISSNHVFTRLKEYEKQIEVWIMLGEKNIAHQLLQQWLQASFTVGNDKDYQLDNWIDWLERINHIEPDKALERVAWFTRSILAVEANTEGRAAQSAAQDLLSATFGWSPRRAVRLFQWLLKKHIIHHQTGLQTLLYAALETDPPPIELILSCLISLGIPLADEPYPKLITLFIEKTMIWKGRDNTLEAAKRLFGCIQRDALPSRRPNWSYGLVQGFKATGIDINLISPEIRSLSRDKGEASSSDKLELKDGSQLDSDEVNKRASTITSIQILLEDATSSSYFDWKPIVAHLGEQLEKQDLLRLADLFRERRQASLILSIISKKLFTLGYRDDAVFIGKQSLEASEPIGWDQWYGGGTRLASLGALVQANPTLGRSLAYETLQQDTSTYPYLPRHIILNLAQILSLFMDTIPIQVIWAEIEQYTNALFASAHLETYEECDLAQTSPQDTSELAIAELIGVHIGHPTNIINQASQEAVAELLIQNNHAIREIVRELLMRQEVIQEQLLVILEAVNSRKPNALLPLQKQITTLYQSPNYAIRTSTRTIYHPTIEDSTPKSSPFSTLPAIYLLELPPQGMWSLAGHEEITSQEPAPDTQDPVEIVRPFDIELSFIAQEANLELVNVCYRVVQIMKQLEPYETWAAQGEKRLREYLEAIGIKFPFDRPRTNLARRAMFHVFAELTDAGVFTTKSLKYLERFLRFYDPDMLLVQPEKRPSCILPITERDWYKIDRHDWLDQVNEVTHFIGTQTADKRIVLAEKTHLQILESTIFEEIRQSMICTTTTHRPSVLESWDQFFLTASRCLVNEYEHLQYKKEPTSFIFQKGHHYDSPGDNWLALNPVIGRQLKWHYVKNEGLFRWVDANNNVMVESIWWKDGPMGWHGSHDHDETGEGWLVVASQEALSQIRNQYALLKRQLMVERECYDKNQHPLRRYILCDTST